MAYSGMGFHASEACLGPEVDGRYTQNKSHLTLAEGKEKCANTHNANSTCWTKTFAKINDP